MMTPGVRDSLIDLLRSVRDDEHVDRVRVGTQGMTPLIGFVVGTIVSIDGGVLQVQTAEGTTFVPVDAITRVEVTS